MLHTIQTSCKHPEGKKSNKLIDSCVLKYISVTQCSYFHFFVETHLNCVLGFFCIIGNAFVNCSCHSWSALSDQYYDKYDYLFCLFIVLSMINCRIILNCCCEMINVSCRVLPRNVVLLCFLVLKFSYVSVQDFNMWKHKLFFKKAISETPSQVISLGQSCGMRGRMKNRRDTFVYHVQFFAFLHLWTYLRE